MSSIEALASAWAQLTEDKSFLDLHDRHLCQIEKPPAVQISMEDGKPTLTYSLWS